MDNNYPEIKTAVWEMFEDPYECSRCVGYYSHGLWDAKSFVAAVIKEFDLEDEDLDIDYRQVCYGVGELDDEEIFWVPSRKPLLIAEFPVTFYKK